PGRRAAREMPARLVPAHRAVVRDVGPDQVLASREVGRALGPATAGPELVDACVAVDELLETRVTDVDEIGHGRSPLMPLFSLPCYGLRRWPARGASPFASPAPENGCRMVRQPSFVIEPRVRVQPAGAGSGAMYSGIDLSASAVWFVVSTTRPSVVR